VPNDTIRAEIKACKGVLSLAVAAKKFGVSRRTIGRIYHGAELSKDGPSGCAQEVAALREQVAQLSDLVASLSQQMKASAPQRFRPALNPELQVKSYKSHASNFSSPHRERPGTEIARIYGFDVQVRHDWRSKAADPWFISQNPVSPDCEMYPYPQSSTAKSTSQSSSSAQKTPDEAPAYLDPPLGTSCTCARCKLWRLGMAWQTVLLQDLPGAAADDRVWRTRR
jgi:hypothetical protein